MGSSSLFFFFFIIKTHELNVFGNFSNKRHFCREKFFLLTRRVKKTWLRPRISCPIYVNLTRIRVIDIFNEIDILDACVNTKLYDNKIRDYSVNENFSFFFLKGASPIVFQSFRVNTVTHKRIIKHYNCTCSRRGGCK